MAHGPEQSGNTGLKPIVEHIKSHYDVSNDFFRLWLDPTMTYSCAYFERDEMTLEEAQRAKVDLALSKLGLQPVMARGAKPAKLWTPPGLRKALTAMSDELTPYFDDVQAHYDLSDDFYRLFLDRTQTYSCAYFECDDMTLEQAQLARSTSHWAIWAPRARDDAAGRRLRLGHHDAPRDREVRRQRRRLDAVEEPGRPRPENLRRDGHPRSRRVLLEGWEQFDEPVDRIVSIGAFEHFGLERYPAFFKMAYEALPADGAMLLHTIIRLTFREGRGIGLALTRELVHFSQFILTEIFPGGWLPSTPMVEERASEAVTVTKVQALQPHYARTLETWAANLETNRDGAVAIQSQAAYDRYMKYLTGCAKLFREGYVDVKQFTLQK